MSVELLSPAGDFETALAAFDAGADAVYCGLADFSARAFAQNLTLEELESLVAFAHDRPDPKKVYVTFNTIVDSGRFDAAIEALARLEDVGPDAVIVQDIGVASAVRRHFPGLELHASTQLVAHNLEGVLALRELGFRRVVLARELSLEEIRLIASRCGALKTAEDGRPETELECFIHGALCYSISGLCLFGAMERRRSGNRGQCPYCCRQGYEREDGSQFYPFSMKDLRLGGDARRLADAGVSSLKIEGRMKSPLYVASTTRYYRQLLGGAVGGARVSVSDLETVFSRHTTKLYFDGRGASPVDSGSPGHVGAPTGTVKKVTRDREGNAWLRFHTLRPLEKHDGLQFDATDENGRRLGTGISEMRLAISRSPVFEAGAGEDVEVLVQDEALAEALRPGMPIYCSMSNAVKRMFPPCAFRPSEHAGGTPVDVSVSISADGIECRAKAWESVEVGCRAEGALAEAKSPEGTVEAVRKAFSRLGGTGYRLGELSVDDRQRRFTPMSVLNGLRRELVEKLDAAKSERLQRRIERAKEDCVLPKSAASAPIKAFKMRIGQKPPEGSWDEAVVAVAPESMGAGFSLSPVMDGVPVRLALPVYTPEPEFNKLRSAVKRLFRAGFAKWECSDLATLRMLKEVGVEDITADWTLYAFNERALECLSGLGVGRFVASPENSAENAASLAESGYRVEFISRQSTPLFVSLTRPDAPGAGGDAVSVGGLSVFRRDGLWVTTRPSPRVFDVPAGCSSRLDISWDPERADAE